MQALAPPALRQQPEKLVDALAARLFQDQGVARHRDRFIDYAKSKKGGRFTDAEVAELLHLMVSTPNYQLT